MILKGILRNLAGIVLAQNVEPTLGMDADGGLFVSVTNASVPSGYTAISVAITDGASVELVPADADRKIFAFFNNTGVDLFLGFGVAATTAGFIISNGVYWQVDTNATPQAINGILDTGGTGTITGIFG